MKALVFRSEAAADMRALRKYYLAIDPCVLDRVLDDIEGSIALVRRPPLAGAEVPRRPFRRIVTRRYRFKIAYLPEDERIVILGIFRYQDRES